MNNVTASLRRILMRPRDESVDVFDTLCNDTNLVITLTDLQGTIKKRSHSFQKLMGNSDERETENFAEVLNHSSRFDYRKALEYIDREHKPVRELQVELTGSVSRSRRLTITPLRSRDASEQVLFHLVEDDSPSSDPKTDLIQIEKLTNVGQIAAGIAHELNTPLGSIILSSGNIAETSGDQDIARQAAHIKARAEHCSSVVRELLSYVRRSEPEHRTANLSSVIAKVLDLTKAECEQRNIVVRPAFGEDDVRLMCNVNQIEQVLFNLINNAIYAIDRDGTIDISVKRDPMLNRVTISVRDDGMGIPDDKLDKIFEPFFTTKPGSQGTGLGLAICKKVALEHGGDIMVVGFEGEGAEFNFWLPVSDE